MAPEMIVAGRAAILDSTLHSSTEGAVIACDLGGALAVPARAMTADEQRAPAAGRERRISQPIDPRSLPDVVARTLPECR